MANLQIGKTERNEKVCKACSDKEILEKARTTENAKKDLEKRITEELKKAEGCVHFCHHTLYDANGKEDSLMGKRTCGLMIKKECGHMDPKYGFCTFWIDGNPCPDWKKNNQSQ
jgi:hypothetical protein